MRLVELLASHGLMFLIGATALLSAGTIAMLLQRSPIHRQRLSEMTLLCALSWALLACIPLPRWGIDRTVLSGDAQLPSTAARRNVAEQPRPTAADLPSDWQSLLASLIRPAASATPQRLVDRVDVSTAQAASSQVARSPEPRSSRGARSERLPIRPAILLVWSYLIGTAGTTGWLLLGHLLLWRVTRTARLPEPWLAELFEDACRRMGVRRARVLVASMPLRPVSCGLWRPTVLLGPDDCAPENRPRLRQVLLHEAAHLKQRDAWGNALFNLAMPLLYFHPLYWVLRAKASLAREMVADDMAASSTSRAAYAADLLELARTRAGFRPAPLAAVGIFRSPSHFYRRMHMLMQRHIRLENHCSMLWKLTSGVACAGVLIAACATLGVSQANAQETPAKKEEIKQEKFDRAILDAKKALNEAIAQRDLLIQQVKSGLTPSALQKYTNLDVKGELQALKANLQVAKNEFGENSARYKELVARLDAVKSEQLKRAEDMIASAKAELESKVALAKQNLDDVQAAQQSVRSAAEDAQDNQDEADHATQQREKQATERRRQLQDMQALQERQMLEAKLKQSEAQLNQVRAMMEQMQQQMKAQADQARAQMDRANAMMKEQMAKAQQQMSAQGQQNAADSERLRKKIDELLLDRIRKDGLQSSQWGEINDMIRRSYLDATGREPTGEDWNATREFVRSYMDKQAKENGKRGGTVELSDKQDTTGLNAAVGGLRPQLDLVALANSYADAMANVTIAQETLQSASSNSERAAAKAKLVGAEQKARLLRSISQAALDQAKREMDMARRRVEAGAAEPGAALDAEGRVRILSLILQSPDGAQPDLQRQ